VVVEDTLEVCKTRLFSFTCPGLAVSINLMSSGIFVVFPEIRHISKKFTNNDDDDDDNNNNNNNNNNVVVVVVVVVVSLSSSLSSCPLGYGTQFLYLPRNCFLNVRHPNARSVG
jgi:hypothetical protein